jgi:hypothetical protein
MAFKWAVDVNQAVVKRQFGCEGYHEREKVRKGHRGRQTFEINFDKECGLT